LPSPASGGEADELPAQFPRQRPRRVAEQLLDRGGVELIDALEVFGMDAAGHEQAVDPETVGAGEIRSHGIPDRQHALERGEIKLADPK